jgi:hypothetical protein
MRDHTAATAIRHSLAASARRGDHPGENTCTHSLHSLGLGVLFNAGLPRGTGSSNPPLSREESANHRFLGPHACDRRRRGQGEPFGAFQCGYQRDDALPWIEVHGEIPRFANRPD